MNQFNGLAAINIELTSRCNKKCWCCGRRKIERDFPELVDWGDMDLFLVHDIATQLPENIVVQFHNNGEPLLYPRFGEAVRLFHKQIKCLDTNGKLLVEKANEIIDNLDSITISVIEDDPEGDEQFRIVNEFLSLKGSKKPLMVYRLLGEITNRERWEGLPGMIANRVLHNPMGSFKYQKPVVIPEIGICLEVLHRLSIDRYGYVSPCVRFDPHKVAKIGNANEEPLAEIWNGDIRKQWMDYHLNGQRNKLQLCAACHYYGIPRGPE